MLRAGVIGLGVGAQHVDGYQANPHCECVAICDQDPEALARVSTKHPDLRQTTCADDLLSDDTLDIISIASYDDVHAEQTLKAIAAGKHVFVEKPLCLNIDEARAIRAALKAHPQVYLSSNLILRLSPRFNDLRERVAAGEFGTPYHVEADYLYGRKHKLTDGWRNQVADYSIILGAAVHMIDLLRWVMDDEIEAVCACGNKLATAGTAFQPDDMNVGLLRFKSGAVGKVSANGACVHPHYHHVALFGDKGTFLNSPGDATLIHDTPEGPQAKPIATAYQTLPKGLLLASFVDAIVGSGVPLVTADDVFSTLAVCFALQEATRTQRWVTVETL